MKRSGRHGSPKLPNAVGSNCSHVSTTQASFATSDRFARSYMDKSCCNKYARAKVLACEKHLWRNLEPADLLGGHREAGT